VAQEIVCSIVGALGLIAAVPVTTALAALAAGRRAALSSAARRRGRTRRIPINVETDNRYEALLFRPRRVNRPG
jgi:hypothetical protein